MTQADLITRAEQILRSHAVGIKVDPDDLEWAVQIALQNPKRIQPPKQEKAA